jgi:hypothetical protein
LPDQRVSSATREQKKQWLEHARHRMKPSGKAAIQRGSYLLAHRQPAGGLPILNPRTPFETSHALQCR